MTQLEWQRSSRCDSGHRVEVVAAWHRASACGDSANCVEVSYRSASTSDGTCVEAGEGACGLVHVRDSKLGAASPVLSFTPAEWKALLEQVNYDGLPDGGFWLGLTGGVTLSKGYTAPWLDFNAAEWDAFMNGVALGEFDLETATVDGG